MPKRKDIRKVMVIGSGPIVIGQAAEFDYAGTQACLSAPRGGLRGGAGQFQSGHHHDRHPHRRQGLHGAADARIRRQNHPLRASRRHRPGPRRADGSESRRAACQEGYFGRMSGRDSRYVVRIHRAGRGPRTVQGVVRIVGRAGVAVRNSHFYRGGCRGGGSHRLSLSCCGLRSR